MEQLSLKIAWSGPLGRSLTFAKANGSYRKIHGASPNLDDSQALY
ncbi:MAG: hypothetical protein HW414_1185 [Dehalococcoidia bacterium]|nr:hypothetical protein [Dehalococcoidia bacterium]